MGNHNDSQALIPVEFGEERHDLPGGAAVQVSGRLVRQEGAGPAPRPPCLPGAEQERVSTARPRVSRLRVLLADEPTGNLDSRTSREIVTLLAELNRDQGLTIVMVTHEESLAREFAGRRVRLSDGKVQAEERWR